MRIVVSGSHATGKSTLIADFVAHHPEFEVWDDPFELIDAASDVPDAATFVAQLDVSARRLLDGRSGADVIAERGPLDFAAYLTALDSIGRGEGGRARACADAAAALVEQAMHDIDVLAVLPIEHDDRVRLGVDDDPELRSAMNDALLELIDSGAVPSAVRVIELTGPPTARIAALESVTDALTAA